MREVFRNTIKEQLIITDEGIHYTSKGKSTIIYRELIIQPLKLSLGTLTITTSLKPSVYTYFIGGREDANRLKALLGRFNSLIGKPVGRKLTDKDFVFEAPEPVEIIPYTKEFRMHCNVCGHVYCYTLGEYKENERLKTMTGITQAGVALTALFSSQYLASSQAQEVELQKQRIKDFSRCPKCNSTDIHELKEGEMLPATETPALAPALSASSPLDELKKLKELLDLGIVAQEEFDAKKKQLLGL